MSASQHPAGRATRLRVLLVEDEMMVSLLLEDMLGELDREVVGPVARLDGAAASAGRRPSRRQPSRPDIYPVAEALAAREIPFFFITGYGKGSFARAVSRSPHLAEAFRRDDLRERIAEFCPEKQD